MAFAVMYVSQVTSHQMSAVHSPKKAQNLANYAEILRNDDNK
jgi:hypothetical protein